MRCIAIPVTRTSADCEVAALALLDDAGQGWSGGYQTWSKLLPGGAVNIVPGDGLAINLPSQGISSLAIVRGVDLVVLDLGGETIRYVVKFVDAGDPLVGFAFGTAAVPNAATLTPIDVTQVGEAMWPT